MFLLFSEHSEEDFVKNPVINQQNLFRFVKAKKIFPDLVDYVDDKDLPLKTHSIVLTFDCNYVFNKENIEKLISFLQLLDTVSFFQEDNDIMDIYGTINIYEEKE